MNKIRIFLLFVGVVLLCSCVPGTGTMTPLPTFSDGIYTQAAETITSRQTLSAGETAVAMLTNMPKTPGPATATNFYALPTFLPTYTPTPVTPTSSPAPPTPEPTETPVAPPCDRVDYSLATSGVPRSGYTPGSRIHTIWRLVNNGGCTWTTDYALIFSSGDMIAEPLVVNMPRAVRPGETVELSTRLIAPDEPGLYRSNWYLQNMSGQVFGTGPRATDPLWVEIRVVKEPSTSSQPLDLAIDYCSAFWNSSTGILSCPGDERSSQGYILLLEDPVLETRHENEPGLLVRPADGKGSWVSGEYPPYMVRSGDHFVSQLGCQEGSRGCRVTFQLDYILENGASRSLGAWDEALDGEMTTLDIDLSALAGRWIQFVLTVYNNSNSGPPEALWFVPHVERQTSTSSNELVLTWHRQGGLSSNNCVELQVYLANDQEGESLAYFCQGNHKNLVGRSSLTYEDLQRLLEWHSRLSSFDAEVYPAGAVEGEITWLVFNGRGGNTASDIDIRAMDSFAAQLLNSTMQ